MYGFSINLDESFESALNRVTTALEDEGFGILTEIDVKATLKKKLGVDMPPYTILGACNPPLAHQALESRTSKREFEACVRAKRPPVDPTQPRRGRPITPPVFKSLPRLRKAIALANSEPLDDQISVHTEPDRVRELLAGLDDQLASLSRLRQRLGRALEELEEE